MELLLRPEIDRHRRGHAAVEVAGQDLGLVDRPQHRIVPDRRAAALGEPPADDGAVGREPHLDRRQRIAGDVAGEDDVRLDPRLDPAGVARRRARGACRRAGGRRSSLAPAGPSSFAGWSRGSPPASPRPDAPSRLAFSSPPVLGEALAFALFLPLGLGLLRLLALGGLRFPGRVGRFFAASAFSIAICASTRGGATGSGRGGGGAGFGSATTGGGVGSGAATRGAAICGSADQSSATTPSGSLLFQLTPQASARSAAHGRRARAPIPSACPAAVAARTRRGRGRLRSSHRLRACPASPTGRGA